MSQRNPMNERYNEEKRSGKTRKSSASAKPKATRAATVRDPAPKSKKQKKEEARERERKLAQKEGALNGRYEETDGYKRLRKFWWAALIGAIAFTALSFVLQRYENMQQVSMAVMIIAYALIILAFYIDLGKIRKERRLYNASMLTSKSKEARKEQKRLRAEQREQEKEAAEKFDAAKAEEEAKKEKGISGLLGRFRKDKPASDEPAADEPAADKSATDKPAASKQATDKPAASKPAADTPSAVADAPAADEPAADAPTTDKPEGADSAEEK